MKKENGMNGIRISFTIAKMPCYGIAHSNGRKTWEVQAYDGFVDCFVPYDYHRQPLCLQAKAEEGDAVDVILLPHRIELYVNGILRDEEWPAGKRVFEIGDAFFSELSFDVKPYEEPKIEVPSVISTFKNAEGWYPGDGVFVGDCMPYVRDGEYHVLYLKDRHHHHSKWGLGGHQWEHISTNDFETWKVHPMAVPITDPDEGSVCTGSWIRDGEKEYLFYTLRKGNRIPAPIKRSVSKDGYHFEKDESFGFTIGEPYSPDCARDPKLVRDANGLFHMFLTTALVKEEKGCLAHLISKDLETWEDTGKPIYIAKDSTQPECPDYFEYGGKYYLVFSLHGKAHYMISDQPFDGFREPSDSIIPCESVPKGAIWDGKIVFSGFRRMGGYAGSMTFKIATANDSGELVYDPPKSN